MNRYRTSAYEIREPIISEEYPQNQDSTQKIVFGLLSVAKPISIQIIQINHPRYKAKGLEAQLTFPNGEVKTIKNVTSGIKRLVKYHFIGTSNEFPIKNNKFTNVVPTT